MIHKWEIFVFASRSTSVAEKTIHFPSGDGTGSSTRLSFIMSSKGQGCLELWAKNEEQRARNRKKANFFMAVVYFVMSTEVETSLIISDQKQLEIPRQARNDKES